MKKEFENFLRRLENNPIAIGERETERVLRWRKMLRWKGFVISEKGPFDQKLHNATIVAQHWASVRPDGVVGPITWMAVANKKRSKHPGSVINNWVNVRPKIIDARHGKAGFPKHRTKSWNKRRIQDIKAKLGHYTGGPASFVADANFHVYSNYLANGGAPAIAYHIGVDKDGTIFVFNDWDDVTWHCDGGRNTQTLGIVFRGGSEGPNASQKKSLKWLWDALETGKFGFGYPPMPVLSTTHRHVNTTSCPGELGEAFYRSISKKFTTQSSDLA